MVDDDRPLFGDRDEMVVVASQESSAYGTVAEPDPPTRSPQMEPLPRYDDPRQRTPVGIDDLSPEDLDRADAGHEVPPTQGTGDVSPPMPGQTARPSR